MKKYLLLITFLSGCALSPQKNSTFKLDDYNSFCPSELRLKESPQKKYIVYESEVRNFYILPGDYILSMSELSRMPQNTSKRNNSNSSTVQITSMQDLGEYFKNQADGLRRLGDEIKEGVFPTEIKNIYPDKKLAKELIVEKYISTENPQIVFCGLTLKSDYTPRKKKYNKYIAQAHVDRTLNNDIYSGDSGANYFSLQPYNK